MKLFKQIILQKQRSKQLLGLAFHARNEVLIINLKANWDEDY